MINYLLPLTITCLFLPFKDQLGPIQVRPFDGMVLLLLLVSLPQAAAMLRAKLSLGLVIIVPFLVIHVLSAFTLSAVNGMRELLQASLLFALAFLINFYADKLNYRKAGAVLLFGLFAVMAYNIGWHISHGFWSGWKRLFDPKSVFLFLPMLLGVYLLLTPKHQRRTYWILWWITGIAIVLSGERKALLAYAVLSVAFVGRGQLRLAAPVAAVGFAGLMIFAGLTDNRYLANQLDSILEPSPTQLSLGALASGEMPRSLSNAAREVQMAQSAELISRHPVFGVGTNAYVDRINQRFGSLPRYLKMGVHNEFLRVFVENGVIGFAAYVAIWLVAAMRLWTLATRFHRTGYFDAMRARLLMITLLVPPFFYVALEASGARVTMAGIVVSLSPDILRLATHRSLRAMKRASRDSLEPLETSENFAGRKQISSAGR
jgi:hypothetical protein